MPSATVAVSPQESPAPGTRVFTSAPGRGVAGAEPTIGGFVAWTLVVLALVVAVAVVVRRTLSASAIFGGQGPIRVVGRRSIGPRQDLVLVEVGSRVLLIGATRDALSLLKEFDAADEAASPELSPAEAV